VTLALFYGDSTLAPETQFTSKQFNGIKNGMTVLKLRQQLAQSEVRELATLTLNRRRLQHLSLAFAISQSLPQRNYRKSILAVLRMTSLFILALCYSTRAICAHWEC